MLTNNKRFAILIDADNIPAKYLDSILQEVAKFGFISIRKIYGDWSDEALNKKWKDKLLPNALVPVHQIAYTKGKNATDIGMVIDAMDLLHSNIIDGFCLVTSDSDFTALALRIRMSGKEVIGFGEEKTPDALIKSCDKFIYVENLSNQEFTVNTKQWSYDDLISDKELVNLLISAVTKKSNEEGFADLSSVGQYLVEVQPNFDPRSYGFAKLSGLMKSTRMFEEKKLEHNLALRYNNIEDKDDVISKSEINTSFFKEENISQDKDMQDLAEPSNKEIKNFIIKQLTNTSKTTFNHLARNFANKFPQINYKEKGFKKASDYFKSFDFIEVFHEKDKVFVKLSNKA